MARMISRSGYDVMVWARREVSFEAMGGDRYERAASPAELGASCDAVGVCVTADKDVHEVVIEKGLLDSMTDGAVLAIHSTIAPSLCAEIVAAAPAGVAVLDAPVSGGGDAGYERKITLMVGGDVAAFERVRPVLQSFGGVVERVGPSGSGLLVKLLNNGLFNAHLALSIEADDAAKALGLDRQAFRTVLAAASGQSWAGDLLRDMPASGSMLRHTVKDIGLLEEELSKRGFHENTLRTVWRAAVDKAVELGAVDTTVQSATQAGIS
jgi:3-hydroxyisobutyrate dehydrogenase-like beta-hydroxyacid dehydrogenase